jgi:hypothetical protein
MILEKARSAAWLNTFLGSLYHPGASTSCRYDPFIPYKYPTMAEYDVKGKVALITGAGSGKQPWEDLFPS